MSEEKPSENDLRDEFHNLGKNLLDTLRTAWDTPERKRLQSELEAGLADLTSTLRSEATTLSQSEAGQKLRGEVDDLRQRVRTGEVETRLRDELFSVLRQANSELERIRTSWAAAAQARSEAPAAAEEAEPEADGSGAGAPPPEA